MGLLGAYMSVFRGRAGLPKKYKTHIKTQPPQTQTTSAMKGGWGGGRQRKRDTGPGDLARGKGTKADKRSPEGIGCEKDSGH